MTALLDIIMSFLICSYNVTLIKTDEDIIRK